MKKLSGDNRKKAPKVVKAWAYIDRVTGYVDARPGATRNGLRWSQAWPGGDRPANEWRIACVEIREVGR